MVFDIESGILSKLNPITRKSTHHLHSFVYIYKRNHKFFFLFFFLVFF